MTAVITGDTKRERRILLDTDRHCWQIDSLLFRPWLRTWREGGKVLRLKEHYSEALEEFLQLGVGE